MPVTAELIGRVFGPGPAVTVDAAHLAAFARSVGYHEGPTVDAAAARAAGFADIIAAPTYAIVLTLDGAAELSRDPEIGLDFSHVVHSDQRFEHVRPITAGDTLTVTTTVRDVKSLAGNTVLTVQGEVRDGSDQNVCTSWTTLVIRPVGQES
ncbi:MAG: MaoC family dehydratase N-terminal domain-containing protein [Actinomycetales bacterium]|nr:MaoC family dehydratase N-terminal domain-containing protein [Actinomycetales bacterium]